MSRPTQADAPPIPDPLKRTDPGLCARGGRISSILANPGPLRDKPPTKGHPRPAQTGTGREAVGWIW